VEEARERREEQEMVARQMGWMIERPVVEG
jgi:hypothetical protein